MHRLRQFWNGRGYYITRLLYTILMRPMKGFSLIGKEHIPQRSTQIIIVANHETHQDPYLIMSYFPVRSQIHWLANKNRFIFSRRIKGLMEQSEYWPRLKRIGAYIPGLVYFACIIRAAISVYTIKSCLTIVVDRKREDREMNRRAIIEIHDLLKNNCIVGFFPEASIFNESLVKESAFVRIALSTHTPILPVAIDWKHRRVIVGEKITPEEMIKLGDNPEEKIMRHVYEMRDNN